MAEALHRAIRDALRQAPGYAKRDLLVSTFFDATRPLQAEGSLLYTSVYTIFRALPDRLMPGSTLNISTMDVEDGVELIWEGRETAPDKPREGDLRAVLGQGPHGDLVEIALVALEQFCNMRAGHVEVRRERVEASTSFDRPAYIVRRVVAHIPARDAPPGAASRVPEVEQMPTGQEVGFGEPPPGLGAVSLSPRLLV